MADIAAKDVKALRDATGAGMMDSKKALVETDGDFDAAVTYLRERGLGKAAERGDRENAEGAVAVAVDVEANTGALVQLKSETDFVAKSPEFLSLLTELAELVAAKGEQAVDEKKDALDDLKVTLKENIELGRVVRFEAAPGNVLDSYLHVQSGRGKNGILVELAGGSAELAHDIAVHIAFGRPGYLSRDEVPEADVAAERATVTEISRNEGKPEAAMDKIVEGRMTGWFKERVLLDQAYVRDEKQTIAGMLGSARIVSFAQVVIGA
jgi:elongation factor Ts